MNTTKKRPSIESQLPEGQIVNRAWLKSRDFDNPIIDYYIKSGALIAVARGAYRRPGPELKWEHILYSLQELGFSVHVGGRSSLEIQGYGHYLPMQDKKKICLYSADKLPSWLDKLNSTYQFNQNRINLFSLKIPNALETKPFGHWDWLINYATPELALLEICYGVKQDTDFEVLDKLFEAAITLRPKLLMELLIACQSIKSKRLFLWYAQRHNFSWFKYLNIEEVNLGSGKRLIQKNGSYDSTYKITVPKEMVNAEEQSFL